MPSWTTLKYARKQCYSKANSFDLTWMLISNKKVWTEMKYGSFQRYIISKDANLDKSEKNSRNHLAQVCPLKQISVSYECLCWFRRPERKRTCMGMWVGPNNFYWKFIRQKFISALRREPPRILLAARTQQFKSVRNTLIDPGCGGTHL